MISVNKFGIMKTVSETDGEDNTEKDTEEIWVDKQIVN